MITAWDPGDTTGYAVWSNEGDLVVIGQCAVDDIAMTWNMIEQTYGPIHVAVIEDFILFGKRAAAQKGSRMKASQGIGMLKAKAHDALAVVVIQAPNVKDSGKKWFKVTIPSDHSQSHQWDAYIHGMVWMHKQGLVKTELEKERGA